MIIKKQQLQLKYALTRSHSFFSFCSYCILFGAINFPAYAVLSATTTELIHGRAPNILFDGTTPVALKDLLSIDYPLGSTITPVTTSFEVSTSDTFLDVIPKVIADSTPRNLADVAQYIDMDGDLPSGAGLTGTIAATWSYKNSNGATVLLTASDLSKNFSACNAPYELKIETSNIGSISAYGLPLENKFPDTTKVYKVTLPTNAASVCYLQPNIDDNYSGYKPSVWTPSHGFTPQSTNNLALNFPTTGFDGAWFNLIIAGIDAQSAGSWSATVTGGPLTATATATGSNVVRVNISGPNATTGVGAGKFSPARVKIADSGGHVSYEFEITKWFITKPGNSNGYANAETFCQSLGNKPGDYLIPTRADYTNNPHGNPILYPPYNGGEVILNNDLLNGTYTRAIGEGIFSEWGDTTASYYTNSDWVNNVYWTSEAWSATRNYIVNSANGYIRADGTPALLHKIACRSR
ncbi:hypothetical protein RHO12_01005 [Orbus sturtevantii]|uniref:hypothetical protein n=1 Tax=Orbus sturtevantii TaxID=3074109 RepID=UPI00370D2ACD